MAVLPHRLRPRIASLPPRALRSLLRFGPRSRRLSAARRLAELGDPESALPALLSAPEPGLRRVAAACSPPDQVREALERERSTSVAVAMSLRCLKAGQPQAVIHGLLRRRCLVPVPLPEGSRVPESALGMGLASPERLLDERLDGSTRGWEAWQEAWRQAGKREQNRLLVELGWIGDPRALGLLEGLLVSMDVDPGRGFAWRRLSALAIGRIGDPGATPALIRAIEVEAAEHEGRPGAGLGIQFPVRAVLLWALGELQDPASLPTLLAHLDQDAGSALGGLHLPALGALYKLGEAAREPLERVASGQSKASARAAALLQVL